MSIAETLAGQTIDPRPGRGTEPVSVWRQTPGVSLIVPGRGDTCYPPGHRSAGYVRAIVEPMARFGGRVTARRREG